MMMENHIQQYKDFVLTLDIHMSIYQYQYIKINSLKSHMGFEF